MNTERKSTPAQSSCRDPAQLREILDRLRESAAASQGVPKISQIRALLNHLTVDSDGEGYGFVGDIFTPSGALREIYHQAKTHLNQELGRGIPQPGERVELRKPSKSAMLRVYIMADEQATWIGEDNEYDRFTQLIAARSEVKTATLIQYSGDSIRAILLKHLIERGAQVTVYLKDPAVAAASADQADKIRVIGKNLLNFLYRYRGRSTGSLSVYLYPQPASLRTVLVDNALLAVGWYVHTRVMPDLKHQNAFDLQGAFMPMVQTCQGAPEFDRLKTMVDLMISNIEEYKPQLAMKIDFATGEYLPWRESSAAPDDEPTRK